MFLMHSKGIFLINIHIKGKFSNQFSKREQKSCLKHIIFKWSHSSEQDAFCSCAECLPRHFRKTITQLNANNWITNTCTIKMPAKEKNEYKFEQKKKNRHQSTIAAVLEYENKATSDIIIITHAHMLLHCVCISLLLFRYSICAAECYCMYAIFFGPMKITQV